MTHKQAAQLDAKLEASFNHLLDKFRAVCLEHGIEPSFVLAIIVVPFGDEGGFGIYRANKPATDPATLAFMETALRTLDQNKTVADIGRGALSKPPSELAL